MATQSVRAGNIPSHVPAELVVDFDAYHPIVASEDYQTAYSRLSDASIPDIFWSPYNGGHWILKRRDHIMEAFSDHGRFTSRNGVSVDARDQANKGLRPRLTPIEEDPPLQQVYRKLFASAFTALRVKELENEARALAIELIEGFVSKSRCEFVTEFAQHLPIRIFMRMLGLPEEDRLRLLPLAAKQVSASEDKAAAMAELAGYIAQRVAERRATPSDDLISHIANAEVEGAVIKIQDAIGVCLLLLIGGLDTVATMTSQIMRFLAQSPEHRQALRDDVKLMPNAIEEFLRRFSLTNPARAVAENMDFHGVAMRAGDMVMLSTPTAAVDISTYADPLTVNFNRKSPTKATFGAGAHVCPGSMLARAEIKVMLQEWLSRIPDFNLDPNDVVKISTGVNITVDRLPLVW